MSIPQRRPNGLMPSMVAEHDAERYGYAPELGRTENAARWTETKRRRTRDAMLGALRRSRPRSRGLLHTRP